VQKPYSAACEKNRGPILEVLSRYLQGSARVLEVGSGTGQHAVFFGAALPALSWLCSDLPANHAGIRAWLDDAALPNVEGPVTLDVAQRPWPQGPFDAVFSANTAHIMSWPRVRDLVAGAAEVLRPGGWLLLYGPFNYGGAYTSESNQRFDAWLAARDPASAIRDFEAVDGVAREVGLELVEDVAMPANNRTLVFRRR
jgi:SAM-dependent methyltransferase